MKQNRTSQPSLFSWVVQQHLDPEHPLMVLSGKIDWTGIDAALAPYSARSGTGHPPKPTRMMVGLMILKHRFDLSDAEVVQGLHENVVWMAFCGVPPEEAHFVESSTLCKFRKRLGPAGTAQVERLVREQLLRDKHLSPRIQRVDTTAMEKHVAYPTDASLLQRGRVRVTKLVKALGRLGVSLPAGVRSFVRVSKKAIVTMAKLGRGRKERIAKGTKMLLSCAHRTLRRVSRTLSNARTRLGRLKKTGEHREHRTLRRLVERLREEARVLGQVVDQTRKRWKGEATPGRVYSIHEPHIACITKNKAGKKHEYGVKVSLSVDAQGFVVDHAEYADNRHDSTTLAEALEGWEEATGTLPRKLTADRGYRAKKGKAPALLDKVGKVAIPRKGKRKGPDEHTGWFRKLVASRAGIEAIISHLKTDHRMNKSRYKGFDGDRMNVSWAVIAWNLAKWARTPT